MSVRLRYRWLLFALLASGAAANAVAADDAKAWLARMNEALTTRNYDGVFFHVHGGRVETMRIIHRVRDGSVMERLVSLDGSGREFVRTGTELACYLPDKRTVLVERRPQETTLLGNLPRFDESTEGFYDLKHVERARLMGRDTRVIAVLPKDGFRYGYRLWIDEATTMPLKTQLCDARGNVIEQIQFANLSLPREIADSEFRPQVDTEGYKWLRQESRQARVAAGGASIVWRALRLPPGFRLTLRSAQAMPGSEGPVEHLVFSDGLASVSVFVESSVEGRSPMTGPARVGSSSAFSTTVSGHQVTAVGEVPPETVRFIANSLKADDAGPAGAASTPPPGLSLGAPPRR
ncbi:MAG: MucB/RseB C-terminal domain-containing protein [Steroidobacteraceae bacterium]|nr:MucB/RseB C-terminal domain-containing protein [Steroidobacteraceae bacterium]